MEVDPVGRCRCRSLRTSVRFSLILGLMYAMCPAGLNPELPDMSVGLAYLRTQFAYACQDVLHCDVVVYTARGQFAYQGRPLDVTAATAIAIVIVIAIVRVRAPRCAGHRRAGDCPTSRAEALQHTRRCI